MGKSTFYSIVIFVTLLGLMCNLVWAQPSNKFATYKVSQFSKSIVVINWYEPEGIARLNRSQYREDFYQLAHFFAPQVWMSFCGVASATMVLNALRIPHGTAPANPQLAFHLPKVWGGGKKDFHFYTQETFFTPRAEKVKAHDLIALKNITPANENDPKAFSPGMTLAELKALLIAHDAQVRLHYASQPEDQGVVRFRTHLKTILKERKAFMIANFHGRSLGMNSGGHISPIAAYDEKTDSLLLLDVAASKRPWVWIHVRDFYLSMQQKDGTQHRGYLIVTDTK